MTTLKSEGHIDFIGQFEYFIRNNNLYGAKTHLPIMPDGYRCGRWECPERMAAERIAIIKQYYKSEEG